MPEAHYRIDVIRFFRSVRRRVTLTIGLFVLFLLIVTAVLEGGFALRTAVSSWENHFKIDRVTRTVAIIGDSVIGSDQNQETVTHHFANAIKHRLNNGVRIVTKIDGSLSLPHARYSLNNLLDEHRSDFAIVMLGKTQPRVQYVSSLEWPPGLNQLHIFRLLHLGIFYFDTNFRFGLSKFAIFSSASELEYAWERYSTGECPLVIPVFERELMRRPNYWSLFRPLYHCYYKEQLFDRGHDYFAALANSSTHTGLLKLYALNLQNELEAKNGALSKASVSRSLEHLSSLEASPESFKIHLRVLQASKQYREFRETLERMTVEHSFKLSASAAEAYQQIARDCLQKHTKLIILQYPTDTADSLSRVFEPFASNTTIIDTRKWLIEYVSPELLPDQFDADMIHIKNDGAKVIGTRLDELVEKLSR